jgi:hypothetical protein
MNLRIKKANPKFFLDILIHHKDVQVSTISYFSDGAH